MTSAGFFVKLYRLLALAFTIFLSQHAIAADCGELSDATISSNCDNAIWQAGNLQVDTSVQVGSGSLESAISVGASSPVSVGTLNNGGIITSSGFGLFNTNGSTLLSVVNDGSVLSEYSSGYSTGFLGSITNLQSSIGSIVNNARHEISASALSGPDGGIIITSPILNLSGSIGSILNSGSISATSAIGSSIPVSFWTFGIANTNMVGFSAGESSVSLISNEGTIISDGGILSAGIKNGYIPRIIYSSPGDALYNNTIGSIINSGLIYSSGLYAGAGIVNGGVSPVSGSDIDFSINTISRIENHSAIIGNSPTFGVGIWNGTLNFSGSSDPKGPINQYIIESISNKSGAVIVGNATSSDGSGVGVGILNAGTIGSIENEGSISGAHTSGPAYGVWNIGLIDQLHNRSTGVIDGGISNALYGVSGGRINTLINDGLIQSVGTNFDVEDTTNSFAIRNNGGATISNIYNTATGTITNGIGNGSNSHIDHIENFGLIHAGVGGYAIYNGGTISTLTNSQGGSTPLTYAGNLPSSYNVFIISPTQFGRLVAGPVSGSMFFGIATGSKVNIGTYRGVLAGIPTANINRSSLIGTYSGLSYRLLLESGTDSVWDLIFGPIGPSASNTLASVQQNASGLSSIYNQQVAAYQAALSYDCRLYDTNNLCVSVGGRYTYAGPSPSANQQAGLVIVGYKPVPTFRLGAFADQSVNNTSPSGITQSKNSPMWGVFAKWHMNRDETGLGVQASAVSSASSITTTRAQLTDTEAGSGTTQFNGQGYQLTTNYHQPVTDSTAMVPYIGLRYTRINTGAYTENSSSTVTAPLSYNTMAQNTFSAIGGVGIKSLLAEKLTGTASVGIQQNLKYSMANYQGTSSIVGLESFSVQMPGNVNSMATATAGVYYDVNKRERLGFNVLWQQQPFIATNTTTALATYTIGF